MRRAGAALLGLLAPLGCATTPQSGEAAVARPATLVCPALGAGTGDLGAIFGVDAGLSGRLERVLRLAETLRASAADLAQQVDGACQTLTLDLRGAVLPGEAPCVALARRAQELKQLAAGGLQVKVSNLTCQLPADAMETCAGECLTGQVGVVSAVSCTAATPGSCALDFSLPNASGECAARCAALAVARVECAASVSATFAAGASAPPELGGVVEALQRDLPRLYGIATGVAPRGAALVKDSLALVDDLASAIDALSRGKPTLDRQAVAGLVLGGCIAPRLADVVRSGQQLEQTLARAAAARAVLVAD